jgi:hypothetical protein
MSAFLSIWAGLRVKAPMRMDFSTKSWCRSRGQWRSIMSRSLAMLHFTKEQVPALRLHSSGFQPCLGGCWLQGTNLWRTRTNPRTWSERLSDIDLKVMWREAKNTAHFSHHRRAKRSSLNALC